ncbi:hypothetical protein Daesc_007182 [Daldinia eschscholtzii]|uniref:Uncharacterized protein n=1 Tax=Daldinia eschscholtzii TaxID=292717 RepID=A0AAX6MD91_9PEZI
MESNRFILQRCQFEECEATIFIKGPYCTTHTHTAGGLKPITLTMSSSTPGQQQPNDHQHFQRATSQPKSNSIGTAPQAEKRGDAITVKAPLPSAGPTNEKKQLPAKMVARKTAGATSSNSKQEVVGARKVEPKPPFYSSPTGDTTSSSQRPLKRLRLSTDVDKGEKEAHHRISSFPESRSYPSPVVAMTNPNDNGHVTVEASDFALRPRNGIPSPLETAPRPRSQEGRSTPKILVKNRPRKQQGSYDKSQSHKVSTHEIIDLTGDDKPDHRPSNSIAETSNVNTPKYREGHAGGSAKAQVSQGKDTHKSQRNGVPARKEQNGIRKISSHLTPRPLLRKPHVHIAPRPASTLLSPDSQVASPATEPKSANDKQAPIQDPKPPPERHAVVVHQNDGQNHPNSEVTIPTQDTGRGVDHVSPKPPPITSPTPIPVPVSDTVMTNGVNRGQFPSEQVAEYIKKVLQNPTRINIPPPKSPQIGLGTPLPRLNSEEASNPTWRSQSREESDLSSTQTVGRSQVVEARPLAKGHQAAPKTVQPTNDLERPPNTRAREPGLASIFQNRRWKHLNPEERRQVWISKHDSDKFDSYIYGKLNEANRPGSALFGLPEYQQPPRPTRPAAHYGHIDPRVHWTHSRSKKWYHEKQNEIYRRGTRKSNFGQVVTRTVKRKRDEGDDRIELPDRVKNNPAWLSALDELDAMAEQYYIQRRKGGQAHQDIQRKEMEMESRLTVADEDGDIEMDMNPEEAT